MATKVYAEQDITLQDDTDVTVRPLPIGRLRRFMEAWDFIKKVEDDSEGFGVFINCAGIAIEHEFKGKFDTLKASGEKAAEGVFLSEEYRTYLEDVLDLDTIYKVIEVAGGLKLNDPKLMEAAMAAAAAQDGKN